MAGASSSWLLLPASLHGWSPAWRDGSPSQSRSWEVIFAALLLVPSLACYAASALALGMLGAIYTELFRGDPPRALFPLVLLGILIVVIRVRAAERWRPGQ